MTEEKVDLPINDILKKFIRNSASGMTNELQELLL